MRCIIFLITFFIALSSFAESPVQAKKTFIQKMAQEYHFNRERLSTVIHGLHVDKRIIQAMTRPYEKQTWTQYRNFFMTPERITLGADYLQQHHAMLAKMQHQFGVPSSIITAIIGVETEYGLHLGKYSVLRTLYTLAFYYPPREKFFSRELIQYFVLARENHLALNELKGSYAGAIGIPQFMPSSYRAYAISPHGKRVDLFHNQNDAIASVANYFHKMGWEPGKPVARQLRSAHGKLYPGEKRIALTTTNGKEYWAVNHNFDVIMRYNHNIVYALVVYQLSHAIERQYHAKNQQKKDRAVNA